MHNLAYSRYGRPKKWQPEHVPLPDLVARPDLRLPYKQVNLSAGRLRNAIESGKDYLISKARVRYEARRRDFLAARDGHLDQVHRDPEVIEAELRVAEVKLNEQRKRAAIMRGKKGERSSITWVEAKARKKAKLEQELQRATAWRNRNSTICGSEPLGPVLSHSHDVKESIASGLVHTDVSEAVASLLPISPWPFCVPDSAAMWVQCTPPGKQWLAEPAEVDANNVQGMELMGRTWGDDNEMVRDELTTCTQAMGSASNPIFIHDASEAETSPEFEYLWDGNWFMVECLQDM